MYPIFGEQSFFLVFSLLSLIESCLVVIRVNKRRGVPIPGKRVVKERCSNCLEEKD